VSGPQGIQLVDYVRAIRRRWPVVVMVTLLVMAAALVASFASQKQYDGQADLLFGGQDRVESLLTPDAQSNVNDPERQLNTDVSLIKLDTVAEAVRRRLKLSTPIADLLDQVTTETSSSSDIVTVTARDPSPRRAAAIATAFAEEYVDYRRTAARRSFDEAAQLAQSRLDALSPEDQVTEEARLLRARKRELEISAALQTGGVEVIRRADVPTSPSRPRPKLSAALGLFLGGLLGIALALALEFADRRLKDEDTVEEVFELPLLAAIPPPPRRGLDDSTQAESYGMLAANVRLTSTAETQVLMVTSPSPEDGKTSVSLGLARALARLGSRVILIEADLRRPSIARYVGLPQTAGLTSLLQGGGGSHLAHEVTWLDATTMQPVTLGDLKEGLSFAVLPAGSVPPNPQRLLARPEMTELVETARSLANVVIIDTPPIGTVNDSVTLARLVDTIIVVARLNKTTKDAARRALRVLRNVSAQLLGVVVTDADLGDYHGYYGAEPSDAPNGRSRRSAERVA
jgi:capsular exopolysaccharide synthesis family protein